MKKTMLCLLLILCLCTGLATAASAANYEGNVTFNGKTLSQKITDEVNLDNMLPGDTLTITAHLKNNYSKTTDWWMKSEAIDSFEKVAGEGAGYTFKLVYSGPNGSRTLYQNDNVGGTPVNTTDDLKGLGEVHEGMKEYFYLDTLKAKGEGTVTLTITLDGETMRNDYQSKDGTQVKGKVMLKFAVETVKGTSARTGDQTVIIPYLAAALVSGLALLTIAIVRLNKVSRKQRGGQKE